MLRQYELVDLVKSYNPSADEAMLNRAYVFATKVHGHQIRHSGDPYFSHPIEVAGILTDLQLDTASIVTALLHDTIEDTDTTYEEIRSLFGAEIANLVNGVTKLSKISFSDRQRQQAEDFRKLFLATSEDVRVLLVKLADRLHNMRTIEHIPKPAKRQRIAQETMDLYAPLANRIGMQNFRDELEDRAFAVLSPEARESILKRLEFLGQENDAVIDTIIAQIEESLTAIGLSGEISGRLKRPYSIWRKMQRESVSFEQLSDVIGFRVIVKTIPECYQALGVLHSRWKSVPGKFKDYISTPKRNGYQSIHTTVFGPDGRHLEVQIRTRDMHEVAEHGIAAHWDYKEHEYDTEEKPALDLTPNGQFAKGTVLRAALFDDLQKLANLFNEEESPEEFLEQTKMEMYTDQVFVFTPLGDLITLPRGATVLDFAYAVHTSIGDTCVGAKINGNHRPLSTLLKNGDTIEVLHAKGQVPNREWGELVVTGRARSAIRRRVRQVREREFSELGDKMLEFIAAELNVTLTATLVQELSDAFELDKSQLAISIGEGTVSESQVKETLQSLLGEPEGQKGTSSVLAPPLERDVVPQPSLPLRGLKSGVAVHFAPCCHPLPGDRIVGQKILGQGVMVHTVDCALLNRLQDDRIHVTWDHEADQEVKAVGRISVVVANEPGVLGTFASVIADQGANIVNLRFLKQDEHYAELTIDLVVRSAPHLQETIECLRELPSINSVNRAKQSEVGHMAAPTDYLESGRR